MKHVIKHLNKRHHHDDFSFKSFLIQMLATIVGVLVVAGIFKLGEWLGLVN